MYLVWKMIDEFSILVLVRLERVYRAMLKVVKRARIIINWVPGVGCTLDKSVETADLHVNCMSSNAS